MKDGEKSPNLFLRWALLAGRSGGGMIRDEYQGLSAMYEVLASFILFFSFTRLARWSSTMRELSEVIDASEYITIS